MAVERSINLPTGPVAIVPASLARCAAVGVLGLLGGFATIVVARRAAGALEHSLEPCALGLTGLLVAAAAMAVRLGWSTSPAPRRGPLAWAVMLLTSLAVVGLGAGLCLPGTPLSAMFLFCTLLLAEESWAWASHVRRCVEVEPGTGQAPKRGQNYFSSPKNLARHPVSRENSSDPFFAPEEVTQQLTRSQAANGAEQLAGWLRLPFAAGQRTGNLHVAFCPPFASTPELTVEQIDGPEARIKTAQVLPYGARLDLKLAAAAEEPTAIVLQFSARTP